MTITTARRADTSSMTPPTAPPTTSPATVVTVRAGDTLAGIAHRAGVSLAALAAENPAIKDLNLIHPGQQVRLPTSPSPTSPSPTSPPSSLSSPALPPATPSLAPPPLPATTAPAAAPSRAAELAALRTHVQTSVLGEGSAGPHVAALQRTLGLSAGGQTGVYGKTTRAAVETFQREHMGMKPTTPGYGQVGRQTLAALEHASATTTTPGSISAKGQAQMKAIVDHARANNDGGSNGRCMASVWNYMTRSGYGKLDNFNDLPAMDGALARGFPDYLNASASHLKEAGLQRLDTQLSPPIRSPHDPRIPAGAVIVVAAGSTGTAHPTAGDIVVKGTRTGEFINDGPAMFYGTPDSWQGHLLGVYVPE